MRPTLSALVRQVLLEASSADEAVLVQPTQLRVSDDPNARMAYLLSPFSPDDEESVSSARERTREVVKKAHAYVNTDRWREAVVRTYTFLDQHKDVRDVVVLPIAADGASEMEIFSAHRAESHVANQMKDVIKLTRNLRDLLVKDLVGKAVFVSVH